MISESAYRVVLKSLSVSNVLMYYSITQHTRV